MKKYISIVFLIFFALQSCEDFLEEEFMGGANSGTIVSSEDMMESLVVANYVPLRLWYGRENGWDLTEAGTDIYTWAADIRTRGFCTYSSWVGEEDDRLGAMWYELYKAINSINLALENIDDLEYLDETLKLNRKGELYFLRAHYIWQLTETWGDVPLTTDYINDAVYDANHSPIPDLYAQIFSDLDQALKLTPETTTQYGRVIKPVVQAFLARMHLTWASYLETGLEILGNTYITADAGMAQQHFTLAKNFADSVINNYSFALVDDWNEIFDLDNENNSEVVWAVVYSANSITTNPSLVNPWDEDLEDSDYTWEDVRYWQRDGIIQREGGNQGHLLWEIRYEEITDGAMTRDIPNGRGFQRWMPTRFFIDLFNEDVDERFKGSFKDTWLCNSDARPVWKPFYFMQDAPSTRVDVDRDLWKLPLFDLGDTAIYFSKKPIPDSERATMSGRRFDFDPEAGYLILDIDDMYNEDGSVNDNIDRQFYFPITKRYQDLTKLEIPQEYSQRDFFVIRISEMYLIAAEATMKLGNSTESFSYLETLANARSFDGDGAAVLAAYGVNNGNDIDIDFILDERARELATEMLRFFDLKRTDKLLERVKAYNLDAAANIQDFHKLRFIPQDQLDAVHNKDEFTQNPGY
ncbi:MAG: RagB/SusD family nutrient uptake outer membrane protein [Bacteroidales bacterium]|nr:RagB/SusD family nutrient uptake outer membrane protein [Bacteroidales bacterium]MBN2817524.1 RagB/SusD family nutrient uptake outer membrane protein [Bacteroidales bacterium]